MRPKDLFPKTEQSSLTLNLILCQNSLTTLRPTSELSIAFCNQKTILLSIWYHLKSHTISYKLTYYFLINVHVNTSRMANTDPKEAGTAMHPSLTPSPCTAGFTNKSNPALAQRLKKSFTPSKSQLKNTKGFICSRFICFPLRTFRHRERHI